MTHPSWIPRPTFASSRQQLRNTRRTSGLLLRLTLLWSLSVGGLTHAAIVSFLNAPLSYGPDSISVTADGVTVTARAFHVEFLNGGSTVYGAFSTGFVGRNQVFGPCARGFCDTGLGLYTGQNLGQTDPDLGGGNISPGFDNFTIPISSTQTPLFSIQFALFSFSTSVDVSQVIVDDVSNFDRSIWAAGGNQLPALEMGLVDGFSGFTVVNSPDNLPSDGVFTHNFSSMTGIRYLAVGTPIREEVGSQGPFAASRQSQFYIDGLGFSLAPNGSGSPPPNKVPTPGSLALASLGLAMLVGVRAFRTRWEHRITRPNRRLPDAEKAGTTDIG